MLIALDTGCSINRMKRGGMFDFLDLDQETRQLMLEELELDLERNSLYPSKRFNAVGIAIYPDILRAAITSGTESTLASELRASDAFAEFELRKGKPVKVAVTAATTFAEGEFNRYYCRAICRKAVARGNNSVEIYRARESASPRSSSQELLGQHLPATTLLDDLRTNPGVDTALGLPPGPNSGLSVK